MSETDDTDDLLLIPPDFFLINTDLEPSKNCFGPYYNIIDNLVTEVINLQDRIHTIENFSDISLVGSSFDLSDNMQKSGFRKYNSIDDLYFTHSAQNTPQKGPNKYKINSLPASPNVNRYSPRNFGRSPKKFSPIANASSGQNNGGGEMLLEIDNFLSKVKTIQRINASRNLESEFNKKENAGDSKETNDDIKEVEEMLKEMDIQQKEIESRIQQKEQEICKEKTWRCGDDINTVPDYGMGIKSAGGQKEKSDVMLSSEKPFVKEKTWRCDKTNFRSENETGRKYKNTNFQCTSSTDGSLDSSSESTQATALYKGSSNKYLENPLHSNAVNVLNMHKQLLEDSIEERISKTKVNKTIIPKSPLTMSNQFGLMSLADIWNSNHKPNNDHSILKHKLSEEKLRRQHCEQLISELQQRNLELQQKISVALTVDEAKDKAIGQLKEVLQNISGKLEISNRHKGEREDEFQAIINQKNRELEEAHQKTTYYEKEASKALNLAHGNQSKLSSLEKKCSDLTNELRNIENKFDDLQESYTKEVAKNKQLYEIISQKEIEISEAKRLLNGARQEVNESKKSVENCQNEFSMLKKECEKLDTLLKSEKNQSLYLKEENRLLKDQVNEKGKIEKHTKEELAKLKQQIDTNKMELRHFYQGQVELLVQSKMEEFQGQLDKAERHSKEEFKRRELQVAKNAASHLQQITEKCSLEIKLLEQKQKEEIRLYQIQMMQYKEENENLKRKMDQMHGKRVQIAQQLQRIMESQWNEAMKIITNGKSPTMPNNQFDELNSLKTRSYNNLEEIMSQEEEFNIPKPKSKTKLNFDLQSSQFTNNVEAQADDDKKSQLTYDVTADTPVSSRVQMNDNEIQKFINMLINKAPESQTNKIDKYGTATGSVDKSSWPQVDQESQNRKSQRDRRLGKPPWK